MGRDKTTAAEPSGVDRADASPEDLDDDPVLPALGSLPRQPLPMPVPETVTHRTPQRRRHQPTGETRILMLALLLVMSAGLNIAFVLADRTEPVATIATGVLTLALLGKVLPIVLSGRRIR